MALTPTANSQEFGGIVNENECGYHNTRDGNIRRGRPNDYSIRDPLNKQGPSDKSAAFDWTFPSAQAGNFGVITLYSARVAAAWASNDPRMWVLAELLCESDGDYDPEGWVFYPTHSFRVPDRSHKWHMHFSFIRKYLNDWAGFDALFSVVKGESLNAWKQRTGRGGPSTAPLPKPDATIGGELDMYMVQVKGNDTVYQSDGWEYQGISYDRFRFYVDILKLGFVMVDSADKLPSMAGEPHVNNSEMRTLSNVSEEVLKKIAAAAATSAPGSPAGSLTGEELSALLNKQATAIVDEVAERLHN
jgi:hypothetical protein